MVRWWSGQAGFTLLEAVVIVVVAAILLGIAVPTFSDYRSNQQALSATRILASDLKAAQQEAVTRRDTIDVSLLKTDTTCMATYPASSYSIQIGSTVIKQNVFAPDVQWGPAIPLVPCAPQTLLSFDSVGIPSGCTEFVVQSQAGKQYTVWVQSQTGAITDDTGPEPYGPDCP
jgi:type IV fimbrial biogenesis protein FimT